MTDQPPANPYAVTPPPMNPADEKLWATLIHVGGIFFGFLPALIGFLVLGSRGPFIRGHTATALNFQLTMIIAASIGAITVWLVIGFFIIIAVSIIIVVLSIIAAVAANRGEAYLYPLTIPFIK